MKLALQTLASVAARPGLLRRRALRARRHLPLLAGLGFHRGVHCSPPSAEHLPGGERSRALRRRMNAGPTAETRPIQRLIFCAIYVFGDGPAGGQRARPPLRLVDGAAWLIVVGDILVAVGLCWPQVVIVEPLRRRHHQGRGGAAVVTTGLYGVVRHPMYAGALIMMLGTPLALDSYWGLAVLIVGAGARRPDRRRGEDADRRTARLPRVLEVRYRLVPYVW